MTKIINQLILNFNYNKVFMKYFFLNFFKKFFNFFSRPENILLRPMIVNPGEDACYRGPSPGTQYFAARGCCSSHGLEKTQCLIAQIQIRSSLGK